MRLAALAIRRKDRKDIEWAIEGDFEHYVRSMSKSGTWGGEPELLMASRVLNAPIGVYIHEAKHGRAAYTRIQLYGAELSTAELSVFFDGLGHYEALIRQPIARL